MTHLTSLRLAGWKSIRDAEIEFRPLNVLIGANGAGKSNLVSFFKAINEIRKGRFQAYVGTVGGAEAVLHYGSKHTGTIDTEFRLATELGSSAYSFRLVPAAVNTLLFQVETLKYALVPPVAESFKAHQESSLDSLDRLFNIDNPPGAGFDRSGELIRNFLTRCQTFHFHDTSLFGPMRRDCSIDANRFLYPDAANLPAMLYLYRERYPTAYRRIVAAVKAVAPFFADFVLEPLRLNPRNIALHWRTNASDYEVGTGSSYMSGYDLGPHQMSDGTLRAIALFTLLLQPEKDLPALIVLDEPELGLHPAALAVLADLLKSASRHSQLLIATQSAALIDHFKVDDVITVNLRDGCSTFNRLDPEELKQWLEEYTLGELWQRNVIGGGPY